MTRIVLASRSPRRRALLEALGIEFDVVVSDAEETFDGVSGVFTYEFPAHSITLLKIQSG